MKNKIHYDPVKEELTVDENTYVIINSQDCWTCAFQDSELCDRVPCIFFNDLEEGSPKRSITWRRKIPAPDPVTMSYPTVTLKDTMSLTIMEETIQETFGGKIHIDKVERSSRKINYIWCTRVEPEKGQTQAFEFRLDKTVTLIQTPWGVKTYETTNNNNA